MSRILVVPGEHVKAGQPMLEVSSPDYSQMLDAYLKAADSSRLSRQTMHARKDLYQHKAIAQRDLQQAESDRNQAQADLNAAEQGMKILGNQEPRWPGQGRSLGADSRARAHLRRSGGAARFARPGGAGRPNAGFYHLRSKTVWVLANVYQSDLAYIHRETMSSCKPMPIPTLFHGRISYVSPALDPNTRTLQARIVVDNPGEKLKKDMYCTVTVTAGTSRNAIAVPDASILRDDNNQPLYTWS